MYELLSINLVFPEIIMILFIVAFPLVLILYCLLDITRSTFQDQTNKIIWAVIVLLAPIIGSLAYLIWGRKQKILA